MTFSTNVPNASVSPGQFPVPAQNNWTRLRAIINADHQFNDTAAANDGYHKVIRWVNQVGAFGDNTPTPIVGNGQLYTKTLSTTGTGASSSEHLMYHQGTNATATNEACLSVFPIRAACTFDGSGANGAKTPALAFNITSVTKNADGDYTIVFTNNMPSVNYCAFFSARREAAGEFMICGQISKTTAPTIAQLRFYFTNNSNQKTNGDIVNVMVFGG